MKLTFLGTGAADWFFEDVEGVGFSRHLTAALLDDDTLIDAQPWLFHSAERYGIDLSGVRRVLVTHLHRDHFSPDSILALAEQQPIEIYVISDGVSLVPRHANIKVIPLEPYTHYTVDRFSVYTMAANHSISRAYECQPLHYVIEQGDKSLFWGCDGAWFLNRTWHELQSFRLDMAVLDGTLGTGSGDERIFEHNNVLMVGEIAGALRRNHVMKPSSAVVMNHMSKLDHPTHEELSAHMAQQDIVVSYDGLIMEI